MTHPQPSTATKSIFTAAIAIVAGFLYFGTTGCADEFHSRTSSQHCTGDAPQHIEVHTYLGAMTQTKLMMALRSPSGTTYLPGYGWSDPLNGSGEYRSLEADPNDCAPIDLAISSYSGQMQFIASETMEMLRIDKSAAELVWTSEKGSAPSLETYFSEEWQLFLLQLVDCSSFARSEITCQLSHPLPPYTVGQLGNYQSGKLSEATQLFLVWRTK
jgi:hypothetical protein